MKILHKDAAVSYARRLQFGMAGELRLENTASRRNGIFTDFCSLIPVPCLFPSTML